MSVIYRNEEGLWAIDSNPYRLFEQYAEERDFVEVVRCKDCKYYNEYPSGFGCCEIHKGSVAIPTPFMFCAWGERKNDAKEE